MTVEEAAAELRVHPESVRRWLRLGRLRAVHVGRRWLIPGEELARILGGGLDARPETPGPTTPAPDPAEDQAPRGWAPYQGRPGLAPRIIGDP